MSSKVFDPYPLYRPAGLEPKAKGDSAVQCVRPIDAPQRPPTPPDIKKYRKSHMQQVGQTIVHYGKYDDQLPGPDHTYGVTDKTSAHVPECLKLPGNDGFGAKVKEFKEEIYLSRKIEPLGRKMERNYVFPEEVHKPQFKFGLPTINSENTAKDLVQSGYILEETPATQAMYKKSHNHSLPAEQVKREYQWPFNPADHRFGKFEPREANQAKKCLQPEAASGIPKTDIIQQNLDDFRNFHHDHLSRVKNLGQTSQLHDPNMIFGKNPKRADIWNVGQCIRGEATFKETYDDPTLGKTVRHGFRNMPNKGDEARVFGVPSIRFDVTKPAQNSVANAVNYGDDPSAIELMFPHCYTHYGLSEKDIILQRGREEIRDIFKNIGIDYKAGKFEGVWIKACQLQNTPDSNTVSVKAFMEAVKQMDHIK